MAHYKLITLATQSKKRALQPQGQHMAVWGLWFCLILVQAQKCAGSADGMWQEKVGKKSGAAEL